MIDWFTVIAQIVNFLILVALLRYFLYGRVLAAMDMRQQEIAARWDEAARQRSEAQQELEATRETNRKLDQQREQLLAMVRDDVEQHRQQLTAKVRGEVDELHERWSDAIQEETDSFLRGRAVVLRRKSASSCSIRAKACVPERKCGEPIARSTYRSATHYWGASSMASADQSMVWDRFTPPAACRWNARPRRSWIVRPSPCRCKRVSKSSMP